MPVSALPRPEFAPNLRTPGVRVTIHGADSPEGRELARLLRLHPGIESAREIACDGGLLVGWDATVEPHWRSPSGRYSAADYVFVCLPPERAAPVVAAALEAGARVIDLSRDPSWSLGSPTEEAAYGLPELTPGRVREADHVASAGSLASCATLALGPVAMAGELDEDAEVQIEATVGLARWPRRDPEEVRAEIEANLRALHRGAGEPELRLEVKLEPSARGVQVKARMPRTHLDNARLQTLYATFYADAPCVDVVPEGEPVRPHLQETSKALIAARAADDTVEIRCALGDALKGAVGQAIQNMNVMCGFPQQLGLPEFGQPLTPPPRLPAD